MQLKEPASGKLTVRAGATFVSGEVRRAEDLYVTMVDGAPVGGPIGLEFAILRLTHAIRTKLPLVAPESWEVTSECMGNGSHVVVFADVDLRFDADDSSREEIWNALQDLPRHTLSDAIESGAQLVRRCVESEARKV